MTAEGDGVATVTPLFSLVRRNRDTGEEVQLYGHCTANVIDDYWEAYTATGVITAENDGHLWETVIRKVN